MAHTAQAAEYDARANMALRAITSAGLASARQAGAAATARKLALKGSTGKTARASAHVKTGRDAMRRQASARVRPDGTGAAAERRVLQATGVKTVIR